MSKPNVISIDGVDYTRCAHKGERYIVVLPAGFVFVGNREVVDDNIVLTQVHNIRKWERGGFGGLTLSREDSGAALDACEDLVYRREAEIFACPVSEDW